jgi:hypothetical protein
MTSFAGAKSYLQQNRPALVRTFEDLHHFVGGGGPEAPADLALYLSLASEFVLIPQSTVQAALDRSELDQFVAVTYSLSKSSAACAAVFVDFYPQAEFPLAVVYTALSRFAAVDLRAVDNAAHVLRLSLRSGSIERVVVYLRLFAEMISSSPKTVAEFLDSFDSIKNKYPSNVLAGWLARGADLVSSGRTEDGVRHLLLRSRESRSQLGITTAVLDDTKKVLQIYCTSVAGRPVAVAGVAVSTFKLEQPYTDGKTVYLPEQLGYHDGIDENEMAYTALAALQAAQIELGSFSLSSQKMPFQAEVQRRYGLVLPDVMEHVNKQYEGRCQAVRERSTGETEVVFAGDRVIEVLATPHEEYYYRFPTPDLMRELFSLVESYRIEKNLASRYPGLKDDFDKLNTRLLAMHKGAQTGLAGGIVGALRQLIRMSQGEEPASALGRARTVLDTFRQSFQLVANPNSGVHDAARAAFDIYNALYDAHPIIPWCRQNDVREIFRPTLKSCIHPEIVLEASPELFAGVEYNPGPVELEEQEIQDIDLTSFTQTERKAKQLREALLSGDIRVYRYHEYDSDRGRTLQKHCTLYESVLEAGESDFYSQSLKQHDRVYRRLKKRFLMMQPEELELSRRWLLGDEIHIGDAFDFATDLLRGATPDEKIYQRRKRNRRDIIAAILLDSSSSTEESVDGETIISLEKQALCLLAGVLAPIGDTFGIFSYFSMGRHNNFYMVAKDFHEKWNEETQGRIANIEASSSNRDGCAIRHTTSRLLERPEKTKLLLLLSDGIPADAGYGSEDGSRTTDYAIEDTRRAVLDARIAGIVPYCITIDRSAKSYIPRLYGDYHYSVIRSVNELPEKLSRLYLRLTR